MRVTISTPTPLPANMNLDFGVTTMMDLVSRIQMVRHLLELSSLDVSLGL